jgi:hypothetical protein
MINNEDLLNRLHQYDYYVVNEMIDLTTGKKRGICKTAVYHNVKLDWNGSAFKFWNENDTNVSAIIDSNIDKIEWDGNIAALHIIDCPITFNIICHKK